MRTLLSSVAQFVRQHPMIRRSARAMTHLVPDIRWTVHVDELGPIRCRIRRNRWVLYENFLYTTHAYTIGIFHRLIRPDDVVYEIGANIGLYTRIYLQLFSAREVIAFEPMRDNFEILSENVALGKFQDRVRLFQVALSKTEGEEALQIDDVSSGSAVLDSVSCGAASEGRRNAGLPPSVERVAVTRLDTVVQKQKLPPPNVMKIDTEGAEVMVIEGAMDTIREHRPRLVIALHGEDKAAACIQMLDELGYHIYGLVNEDGDRRHQRLAVFDAKRLGNNNIIASTNADEIAEPIVRWQRPAKPEAG